MRGQDGVVTPKERPGRNSSGRKGGRVTKVMLFGLRAVLLFVTGVASTRVSRVVRNHDL